MQPIRLPSLTREIELMEEEERSPSPRLDSEQPHPPQQHQPHPPYQQQYQFQLHMASVAGAGAGAGAGAASEPAAGTSAGAGGRRSERWAKQNDWDAHRDIITSLYRDRGLTLKRVKETMEREYQFYSTERMYKFRLKQWGVAKYIKQRDMGGVGMGPAANPAAAAEASLLGDYTVDRHEGDHGRGDGAGMHIHGRYYPFVHSQFLPDGSISDARLQLTNASPGAHKTDGSRPPPPHPCSLAYRPHKQHHVLTPTPPPWSYPATVDRLLVPPGDVRVLDICVGHLQRFAASVCEGASSGITNLDRSPEVLAERIGWTVALGKAVNEIHLGRIAKGFRQLDATFAQYQSGLGEGDAAFFLKLTTALALLSDQGLTGLDAVFLRYISSAASVVMSPSHPFAAVTRQLQALDKSTLLQMAWHLLATYTNMLRQPGARTEEPSDVVSQLTWDMSRCVDLDYTTVLSEPLSEWGWDLATTALLVTQVQISQRRYSAARRTVDKLLAQQAQAGAAMTPAGGRSNTEAVGHGDALIVALALRKRWDISRAAGGDHGTVCRDAAALIHHCRAAFGPGHYATMRATDEHGSYLRARQVVYEGSGGAAREEREVAAAAAATAAEEVFVDGLPPEG